MNNIFVYIENEGGKAAEVCLELMTKGRELATTLGVKLEAVVLGENLAGIEHELAKYGADTVWIADDKVFAPFRTLPHTAVMCGLIEQEKPPDRAVRRDVQRPRFRAARVVGAFRGLTADCTQLVIGDHKDAKSGREYKDLLYQIRPPSAATSSPRSSTPTTVRRWPPSAKASCAANMPPSRVPAR